MKKFILIYSLLFSISLVGCGTVEYEALDEIENPNFIDGREEERFIEMWLGGIDYIYIDKETGVQYFFVGNGSSGGGGMTVLVDADGKPLLFDK